MGYKLYKRLLLWIGTLIAIISIYETISFVLLFNKTGILQINCSDPNAVLSIGQAKHETKRIGTGNAKVRLAPGEYQIFAIHNGYQVSRGVQILISQNVTSKLTLPDAAQLSSSYNLFSLLPYIGPSADFRIIETAQTSGNGTGPALDIYALNAQAQQAALAWVRIQGYNPSNYVIKYKNSVSGAE